MSRQKHDKFWLEFVAWCRQRQLKPMPAHAWTVAAYLRWKDRQDPKKADIVCTDRLIKIISRAHLLCGYPSPHSHPVIAKTLASIERRQATAPDRSDLFSLDSEQPTEPQNDDEAFDVDQEPEIVSGIRTNFSLRTQPKLVSKRIPDV